MTKPVKRVDLSQLTAEQRAAFIQLYKDARSVAPQRSEMVEAAHILHQQLLKAPVWGAAEGAGQPQQTGQRLWHVGHPHVNYVDHIERATDT